MDTLVLDGFADLGKHLLEQYEGKSGLAAERLGGQRQVENSATTWHDRARMVFGWVQPAIHDFVAEDQRDYDRG